MAERKQGWLPFHRQSDVLDTGSRFVELRGNVRCEGCLVPTQHPAPGRWAGRRRNGANGGAGEIAKTPECGVNPPVGIQQSRPLALQGCVEFIRGPVDLKGGRHHNRRTRTVGQSLEIQRMQIVTRFRPVMGVDKDVECARNGIDGCCAVDADVWAIVKAAKGHMNRRAEIPLFQDAAIRGIDRVDRIPFGGHIHHRMHSLARNRLVRNHQRLCIHLIVQGDAHDMPK